MGTLRALCWDSRAGSRRAGSADAPESAASPAALSCQEVALPDAAAAWRDRGAYVWLDVTAPTDADMQALAHEFGLHDAVVRNARVPNSRPRVIDFGSFITITLYVPRAPHVQRRGVPPFGIAGSGLAPLSEIDFVCSQRFLISAHPDPIPLLDDLLQESLHSPNALAEGMGGLVHHVLNEAVDAYFPVLDKLIEQVEEVQEFAFVGSGGPPRADAMRPLFRLKKGLLALRRVMSPQADALRVLAREGVAFYREPVEITFQDVFDRAVRVEQTIQLNQDLLINARESFLTRMSNELGIATQALLVVTCLILVPLFIGAFYGMNFDNMPEHRWALGHGWGVMLIVVVDGALLILFRRWGWA